MYDLTQLHNPDTDYNGLIPYRSVFPSVYQGITVEMHIVNHCNLNCAGCNHFSPLAEPWFIDVQDFELQISTLVKNIPTVKELILLGGEPTLHPQLLELCTIARQYIPNDRIVILSNGLDLSIIKDHFKAYKELKIDFNFCSYPSYTDADGIKQLSKNYETDNAQFNYFNTRHISRQTLVDITGSQDADQNFFHCTIHKLPCFTLRDFKLFICPFSAHLHLYESKKGITIPLVKDIDYLDINDIQGNLDIVQDFCFTKKEICKYCHQTNDSWIWHFSTQDTDEYDISLSELYFQNYSEYYNIINNNFDYFIQCCSRNNPCGIDIAYNSNMVEKIIKRIGLGKIDIIIPHYQIDTTQAQYLIYTLTQQTIINDCVIYFISDDSPNERELIEQLQLTNLNYVLLKNETQQGPGAARNLGINNSFNKYLFFLDADDYFCTNTALEELYNKAEEGFDIVNFIMFANNFSNSNKFNFLINRNYLKSNNIEFNNLYFGEDFVFQNQLFNYTNKIFNYNNCNNIFAVYNKYNTKSLSDTLPSKDNIHFNFLTSRLLASKYLSTQSDFDNTYWNLQSLRVQNCDLAKRDFYIIFSHWVHYQLYKKRPQLYTESDKNNSRLLDFNKDIFHITLSDRIIMDERDALVYIRDYIYKYLLDNQYTQYAANKILEYMGEDDEINL